MISVLVTDNEENALMNNNFKPFETQFTVLISLEGYEKSDNF